jgi:hypothetical protein
MEMEMEAATEVREDLSPAIARLAAAAAALEQAAERIAGVAIEGSYAGELRAREAELEDQLREAEATIATLRAGRRTEPCSGTTLMAKEGRTPDAGALDAALKSLSPEQRIAVKSEMMRAGLLG